MKKSRVIALLTAIAMIMSVVPAFAEGYFVDEEGYVYKKSGSNLIEKSPGFEEGINELVRNDTYYEVIDEKAYVHSGSKSLKAVKSTKKDGALLGYFPVDDANAGYYLSFWYLNTDEKGRRPRVTFAFTDENKTVPTVENEFTEATGAWIGAGTNTNDQGMEYSKGNWVKYSTVITGNGNAEDCAYVVLNIYGLTKDVSYVDDFEVYKIATNNEYQTTLVEAIEKWEPIATEWQAKNANLRGVGSFELPYTVDVEGVKVDWYHDDSKNLKLEENYCHYTPSEDDVTVIMTARLSVVGHQDEIYVDFEYPIRIENMFVEYVDWMKNEVFTKIPNTIKENIEGLPAKHSIDGYEPVTITWSCSEAGVIGADGKFTAPETTGYVNLIANLECSIGKKQVVKRVKVMGGTLLPEGLVMYYDFETPAIEETVNGEILYYVKDVTTEKSYDARLIDDVIIEDGFAKFGATSNSAAINLPDNYTDELTGSYTVSMWVNVDKSIASNSELYRFFDFGGSTMSSQFLRYTPFNGELAFMDRSTAPDKDTFPLVTSKSGFGGAWKFITLTYENMGAYYKATLYVDGAKAADTGTNGILSKSVAAVANADRTRGFIGRTQWMNSGNPDFKGLMDDVRIYNRAISEAEILTLYDETRPVAAAPVTINFVDTDGKVLKDPETVSVEYNTNYDVPDSYKTLPSREDDDYRYVYKYISSKSTDFVYVTETSDNNCTLVFELILEPKGVNLLEGLGFDYDFEKGIDGWTSNNAGVFAPITGWVRSDEQVHGGGFALKKVAADASGSSVDNFGTYIPIESGKKYRLTFWEYSGAEIAPGNHMMTAVCITSNKGASNASSDHFLEYGGYSSWYNDGNKISPRDVGHAQGWNLKSFEFDTTGATNANYIFIAYARGGDNPFYVDDFCLEEVVVAAGDTVDVTIKYVDSNGNTILPDEVIKVPNVSEYVVPDSYKNKFEAQFTDAGASMYAYNAELSTDLVYVSTITENVATLVYDLCKADLNGKNLVTDGSFINDEGYFSFGTWESPRGDGMFSAISISYFYSVDKATNAAALYVASEPVIGADDYALGTRWNDGVEGLCSMANFIPVEKGKTYFVLYDYKHKTAGADANSISTSFVEEKSFAAGATGMNVPTNVSTEWQTNKFAITAPSDGYIYFHFSWLGESGNPGNGPYWYFDNFKVIEANSFENYMNYEAGFAEIYAEDGTTGYLIQALYNEDNALEKVAISRELTLSKEIPARVEITLPGAKLMLVKDLITLMPLARSITAK